MTQPAGRARKKTKPGGSGEEAFETSRVAGRVGSGRVGSGRVGSGRVGSGRVGSESGSGRVGSGRVESDRVVSGHVGPARPARRDATGEKLWIFRVGVGWKWAKQPRCARGGGGRGYSG